MAGTHGDGWDQSMEWIELKRSTMDFKPSVSVLFGHYSLLGPQILTKLGRSKFEMTT